MQYSSMATIHFDGFYYSRPIAWEEWHAGVRMHGGRVHFRRYYPNRIWLGAYRDNTFDFWSDSEQLIRMRQPIGEQGAAARDHQAAVR